jgi:hypothetical protein
VQWGTFPRLRTAGLVAGLLVLGASPANAALAPGCANPSDSALNQYCDALPAAPGGQIPPRPGAAALVTALPARVVREITRARTAPRQARSRQKLLLLPAPTRPSASAGALSASSFPAWLMVLMAALALALVAAAILRRRRSRAPAVPRGSPA